MFANNYFLKKLVTNSLDKFCAHCKHLHNLFVILIEDSIENYTSLDFKKYLPLDRKKDFP